MEKVVIISDNYYDIMIVASSKNCTISNKISRLIDSTG